MLGVRYGISAWYPPAAISLYVMIRYGPRAAVAIFAASLIAGADQWAVFPSRNELIGSLTHTAAYLAAADHYRRRAGPYRHSIRPRSIALLGASACLGATLSAIFGNANIYAASSGSYEVSFERIFSWITGDFFGVASVCPFLVFIAANLKWSPATLGRALPAARTAALALAGAIAIALAFAAIAENSGMNFRLICVVGVGVYSVIIAYRTAPRSAVTYLFCVGALGALWLATEAPPDVRVEFAFQISTFIVASFAMMAMAMDKMRSRVAAANRALRLRDLALRHEIMSRRVDAIETEFKHLAHEFKTPLGGILGLLELTETGMETGVGREQVARYVTHMRGCAQYLRAMVDDAFDVSRIASGRFEPAIGVFEINDVLDDLALIAKAKAGGAVAFPQSDETRDVRLRSDRNRLLQILINLVVNAVRYTDRRDSVRVRCAVGPDSVTVTVENAAADITKDRLDAYIAGGQGVARNSQGLGVGLPLVGRLAAGIGAQVATRVSDGVVAIAITAPRA